MRKFRSEEAACGSEIGIEQTESGARARHCCGSRKATRVIEAASQQSSPLCGNSDRKKRLAEAKLESSKLNLARVHDIVVEVEKQLVSLKRQASKARRYAEIREQMRGLLRMVMASKARELDSEADRLALLLQTTVAAETEQTQSLSSLELEHEKLTSRTYELDGELRQNQNILNQTALELDRAENRISFNHQRRSELDTRTAQIDGQIMQAEEQTAAVAARAAEHFAGVETLT